MGETSVDKKYQGTHVQGLIQAHIVHSFVAVIFTEQQVKYAVLVTRTRFVFAYFDSAGTIIADPP